MSRTNQEQERTGSSNPSKRFVEFNGEKGVFTYYDKEKKEDVTMPWPVSFLVLDQRHTVKGWNKANNSAIFSNEVLDINEEEMDVRTFKGDNKGIAKGLYPKIKDKVKAAGGKYVRSVYVMLFIKETNTWEMSNIAFKGACSFEWNEFLNNMTVNKYNAMIFVKKNDVEARTMGNVNYFVPKFSVKELSKDNSDQNVLLTQADKEDMVLQDYFAGKVKEDNGSRSTAQPESTKKETVAQEPSNEANPFDVEGDDEDDDLPF